MSAFDTLHSISTPPPELNGSVIGGDENLIIDTGPAQDAVRRVREEPPAPDQDPPSAGGVVNQPPEVAESSGNDPLQPEVVPSPAATPPATSDGVNILLMAVDAQTGESIDVGIPPDSLAVLHLDQVSGSCRVLAIPENSRVELPGYGMSRINNALAVGGIPYEQQVIESYLDIDIDHYALVDFTGMAEIVDAIDGITVDNPEAFTSEGKSFAAGPITLDGAAALVYSRHEAPPDGDEPPVSRQQQVLRAVIQQVSRANPVDLVRSMLPLLIDYFRTDYGITDLLDLSSAYRNTCTSATLETASIPGQEVTEFDEMSQQDHPFVISDEAAVRDRVDWLINGK
jgi:LCP family protein required for cell wall assembly